GRYVSGSTCDVSTGGMLIRLERPLNVEIAADLVAEVPPLTAMAAFGLAWAVGFVAVPLPAGLGLREAVLVLALTGIAGVDADAVIAASLVHRFVLLSAELVMFAQSRLRLLVRPGAAATISPAAPTSSSSSSHMSQPEEGR
ncbi:MAG: hypothetical protein S0880_16025, partial [Actinomycetota bacterium]|nr:hypothetical protein [Actinomycetota bacterium]